MAETARQKFGRALRDLRLRAGLAQWDIAFELGYGSAQFVSNWERGVSMPPVGALPKIAKMVGAKPAALVHAFYDVQRQELADEEARALKMANRRAS